MPEPSADTARANTGYLLQNKKLEHSLLDLLQNDAFRKQFSARLNSSQESYWQILSEMRAVHVFQGILGIPVVGIGVKANGKKNVDFLCDWNGERIFVEVKGFRPEDYEIVKRVGSLGAGEEKIDRALRRSQNKFLENVCNIVVVADEDTVRPPLFVNLRTDAEGTPEIYLNKLDYRKTSAVMVLGGMYYDQMFKYKIWYNANAQCVLPPDLMSRLDENRSNAKWPWQN